MNLRLLQLGDSALPIGGYSHSWGLEAAIDRRLVHDAATLESWARRWLTFALGPAEGVVVATTCRAAAADDWHVIVSANALLSASLTPLTLRHASRDMGGQLLALAEGWPWSAAIVRGLREAGGGEITWHHAAVFGALAAAAGAGPKQAVLVLLHQAALEAIGAGVRAVPIGHSHGQQVLARLHGDIEALAHDLAGRDLEAAGSFCPAYEVLCHAQSGLYTRLFRS